MQTSAVSMQVFEVPVLGLAAHALGATRMYAVREGRGRWKITHVSGLTACWGLSSLAACAAHVEPLEALLTAAPRDVEALRTVLYRELTRRGAYVPFVHGETEKLRKALE